MNSRFTSSQRFGDLALCAFFAAFFAVIIHG